MTPGTTLWLADVPRTQTGANGGWTLLWGVLGFAAILLLSYLALRWLTKRNAFGARSRYMTVLDRMSVSRDCTLLIVRILDEIYAVGVTKDGVSTLAKVDPDTLEDYPPPPRVFFRARAAEKSGPRETDAAPAERAEGQTTASERSAAVEEPPISKDTFLRRFVHNFGVYSGLLPKNTPVRRPRKSVPPPEASDFSQILKRSQAAAQAATPTTPEHMEPQEAPARVAPRQERDRPTGARPSDSRPFPPPENASPRATDNRSLDSSPPDSRDYDKLFEGIRSFSEPGVMPGADEPKRTETAMPPKSPEPDRPTSAGAGNDRLGPEKPKSDRSARPRPSLAPRPGEDPLDELRDRMARRSANIEKKREQDTP